MTDILKQYYNSSINTFNSIFPNVSYNLYDFKNKITINTIIDSIRNRTEDAFSLMSLFETFTIDTTIIGFLVFILPFTAISVHLILKNKNQISKFLFIQYF